MSPIVLLQALINTTHYSPTSLEKDPNIRLVVLFDNEEVGSVSAHGAASSLLEFTIRRLVLTNVGGKKDVSKVRYYLNGRQDEKAITITIVFPLIFPIDCIRGNNSQKLPDQC